VTVVPSIVYTTVPGLLSPVRAEGLYFTEMMKVPVEGSVPVTTPFACSRGTSGTAILGGNKGATRGTEIERDQTAPETMDSAQQCGFVSVGLGLSGRPSHLWIRKLGFESLPRSLGNRWKRRLRP
jgi:hypothetical protein